MTVYGLVLLFLLVFKLASFSASPADAHSDQEQALASYSAGPLSRRTWAWTSPQRAKLNLDNNSDYAKSHPLLLSTHSTNPWSRRRRQWRLFQVPTISNPSPIPTSRTIHVSARYGNSEGFSGTDGGEGLHARSCPENVSFFESFRYGLDECKSSNIQVARTVLTLVWLMVLFYLLGSTASDYFSCTLEKLSDTLKLSPAVAGVTLLAIGNGAPDVFSSVAAFVSSDKAGGIGFSCVLGGALFITTVVSGTVALVTDKGPNKENLQKINLLCFVRDATFLLASSAVLIVIILDGKVYLWEAALFLSVYAVYAVVVWAIEGLENRSKGLDSLEDPLLSPKVLMESLLPQWTNASNMQHHHYHLHSQEFEAELEDLLKSEKDYPVVAKSKRFMLLFFKYGIEGPLALPRRLTIPVIEEERWSRAFAVASCSLAPVFVGGVLILQTDVSGGLVYLILGISVCVGVAMGTLAFMSTENEKPPHQHLWLWLGGGFLMSIVWFYLVADQVVASLETLGDIFSINPAILGLTVLAWGNSIGDLVADLALACGSKDGVQIAISGCYAGPLFNIVVGLGLSLVIACWRSDPSPLVITDEDGSLFFMIGFLAIGLIWALFMMPLNKMRLSKTFGAGLLVLYCTFLAIGMCYTMGWISR